MTVLPSKHEEIQELLGAFALDAVEPDEARLIERHLEHCPRCRGEVADHREVAGLLGYAGQEAPAGLWDRIVAGMQEPPPAMRLERVPTVITALRVDPSGSAGTSAPRAGARRRRVSGPSRWSSTVRIRTVVVAAAAAAVVVAVLGVQVLRLDHRTAGLATAVAGTAEGPTMRTVQAALETPGARRVALAPLATGQDAAAVVLPDGQGYLYDAQLTPLPGGQTYQLWGITGSKAISYGLLGATPSKVVPFRAGPDVQTLAVTAEVAGGVVHSDRAPVAAGGVSPA